MANATIPAESETAYDLEELSKSINQVRLLVESAGAFIERYKGCQLDGDDLHALLEVIEKQANAAHELVTDVCKKAIQPVSMA